MVHKKELDVKESFDVHEDEVNEIVRVRGPRNARQYHGSRGDTPEVQFKRAKEDLKIGGPAAKKAEKTLRDNFGHTDEMIAKIKMASDVKESFGGEDPKIEIDKAIRRAKGDLNDAKDDAGRSADKKWGSSLVNKHQDHLSKLINHKKSGVTHVNHRTGEPIK